MRECVRVLYLDGSYDALKAIPTLCANIEELGITLDGAAHWGEYATLQHVKKLSIRKKTGIYLTDPAVRKAVSELAGAIGRWDRLVRYYTCLWLFNQFISPFAGRSYHRFPTLLLAIR